MEIIYIIGFIALIRLIIAQIQKHRNAIETLASQQAQSLCIACAYAHIAHGFTDRQKLIACTYGGSVRTLKFAVSNCTLFCNRNAGTQIVRVIGFADTVEQSVSPSVAAKSAN